MEKYPNNNKYVDAKKWFTGTQEELAKERQKTQADYDEEDSIAHNAPAPYKEHRSGATTVRVAPGYEHIFGDSIKPGDWKEPTDTEADSGESKLEDSNNLWLLKERKVELERRRQELESELNAIEQKIREI